MRFRHGEVVGEIDNLPGCSQVAVLHSVFVPSTLRGKGLGFAAHAERLTECEHLGYDMCLCTADLNNSAQCSILHKYGWHQVGMFISSKTGHSVGIFLKGL